MRFRLYTSHFLQFFQTLGDRSNPVFVSFCLLPPLLALFLFVSFSPHKRSLYFRLRHRIGLPTALLSFFVFFFFFFLFFFLNFFNIRLMLFSWCLSSFIPYRDLGRLLHVGSFLILRHTLPVFMLIKPSYFFLLSGIRAINCFLFSSVKVRWCPAFIHFVILCQNLVRLFLRPCLSRFHRSGVIRNGPIFLALGAFAFETVLRYRRSVFARPAFPLRGHHWSAATRSPGH